jgi:hypothetical protein
MQIPLQILPSLPHLSGTFFINFPVLLVILVLFFICYSVIVYVLIYHWNSYGMGNSGILAGESLFLIVSVALFVLGGLALHYY